MTVCGHSIILGVSEHIDEESLERYALGRSLPSESEWIEEHLLVCGPCREALVILDRFIPALRPPFVMCVFGRRAKSPSLIRVSWFRALQSRNTRLYTHAHVPPCLPVPPQNRQSLSARLICGTI